MTSLAAWAGLAALLMALIVAGSFLITRGCDKMLDAGIRDGEFIALGLLWMWAVLLTFGGVFIYANILVARMLGLHG